MIYTVTLNPAIDYVIHADNIKNGDVNRTDSETYYIGGKGINVSIVLSELGIKSVALGFIAGFTGDAIEKGVQEKGIETDFIRLEKGFSRINVKIKSECETEINGQGPVITDNAISELFRKINYMNTGDTIVLAGSIPKTMNADIYERILAYIEGKGVRAVVDASGKLLLNVLKYKPFLVKPNNFELAEMFCVDIDDILDVKKYAGELQKMGARNVLVSMAGEGAVLLAENGEFYTCGVCNGRVRNSVGAGDSMVAGFIAGIDKSYEYALKLGTACGGATAFSDGLAEKKLIDELLKTLI